MNSGSKIQAQHLERSAIVYIRQSSLRQVEENLESQDVPAGTARPNAGVGSGTHPGGG
jgi:hypothetical protein